jgi:hypothetical protein
LLLEHKAALFDHLVARWRDLFNVGFEVLLYGSTTSRPLTLRSTHRWTSRASVNTGTHAITGLIACRW